MVNGKIFDFYRLFELMVYQDFKEQFFIVSPHPALSKERVARTQGLYWFT